MREGFTWRWPRKINERLKNSHRGCEKEIDSIIIDEILSRLQKRFKEKEVGVELGVSDKEI